MIVGIGAWAAVESCVFFTDHGMRFAAFVFYFFFFGLDLLAARQIVRLQKARAVGREIARLQIISPNHHFAA